MELDSSQSVLHVLPQLSICMTYLIDQDMLDIFDSIRVHLEQLFAAGVGKAQYLLMLDEKQADLPVDEEIIEV